jgi:hypothetical protein
LVQYCGFLCLSVKGPDSMQAFDGGRNSRSWDQERKNLVVIGSEM